MIYPVVFSPEAQAQLVDLYGYIAQAASPDIAARYTAEVLGTVDGTPTRAAVLAAFQRRQSVDLGGFRVSFNAQGRGGSFVTQSMIAPDGRLIG